MCFACVGRDALFGVVPLGVLGAVRGWCPPQAWRCAVLPCVVLCPSGCLVRCVAGARRKHDVCVPMCDSVTHFGRMLASHPSELDPLQVHGWALVSALCRLRRKAPLM